MRSKLANIKLIVSFPQADGEEYMERILEERTLQGTVSPNGLGALTPRDRDRRELLHGSFPRINLDTVPTLIVGRATWSTLWPSRLTIAESGASIESVGLESWSSTTSSKVLPCSTTMPRFSSRYASEETASL